MFSQVARFGVPPRARSGQQYPGVPPYGQDCGNPLARSGWEMGYPRVMPHWPGLRYPPRSGQERSEGYSRGSEGYPVARTGVPLGPGQERRGTLG